MDARFGVQPAQGSDNDDGEQYEIPVVEQLDKEDATQVVLARELAEHAGGGASEGVGEIGRVAQVDDERQTVDYDEEPFAEALVATRLLQIQGEEHQHDVEGVGVDDGRRVEGQTALEKPQQMAEREPLGEMAEVDQQVGHAGDEINQEDQQEIPDECRHRGERGVEDAEFLSLFVSHRSSCLNGLHVVQLLVESVELQEFVVSAAFYDAPFVEHANLVGVLDGREPVGNGHGGARLHQSLERILHQAFALGVEG